MKKKVWLLLADSNQCRLLCCEVDPNDHCHVEEYETIENQWEGHEQGRPSSRTGKSGHSYASQGHDDQEQLHRFAHHVGQWLDEQVETLEVDRLTVFAPPRFLGALRKAYTAGVSKRITEKREDLVGLGKGQLSIHPVILELVGLTG